MGIERNQLTDAIRARMEPAELKVLGKAGRTFAQCEAERLDKLEREDHRAFIGWLERNEYAYAHNRTDKRATTNLGVPDFLIGCRVGLALEFKRSKGGRLSTEQTRWRARHEARGGIYRVVCTYQEAVGITEAFTS
jgi:hypothetical protein